MVARWTARGSRAIHSFDPSRIASMERIERRDGSGDLVFEVIKTRNGSNTSSDRRGFLDVADVHQAETLLRQTLLRDRVRDA